MGKNFKGDNLAILMILCIIPLAMDKLYKESVLLFIIKLFSAITIIVFAVWWLMDIIMCAVGKYETNPIRYFKKSANTGADRTEASPAEKPKKARKDKKDISEEAAADNTATDKPE